MAVNHPGQSHTGCSFVDKRKEKAVGGSDKGSGALSVSGTSVVLYTTPRTS